mmetsp:Transcript_13149/g.35794  ORF Transcript_13149/g.35794 Transcript_13149/m.35794 type:complete len:385 (+) Transcript_13149:72-1226(+)|eukprot:CAMPEP_0202349038 /NCGR_PEP_ID=MMETSP1126-20121109/6698_1 /ASSEMBLY_ACC=CAM_ASM_000457 /TAXON_ID=3047 /ORGANISM="Dunaliella tertiolecta, Strain CCMP1320" /LENGTH=384 /DNA_ID=CAMNT_0048940785 /DNA_START=157 /DNA_END=1311 /DNA_ORIENTATION=-
MLNAMMQSKQHVIAKGAMSAAPTMLGISSRSNIASSQQSSSASSYTPASLVSTRSTGVSSRPASRQQSISRRGVKTAAGNGGGLQIDLTGKKVFIAGVADDQGFGWGIAKALAEAGAEISLGVWVPALNIFESSYRKGKFDESRKLSNGSLMEFKHVFPMDAVFDTLEDVPEEIANNKRYAGNKGWTVSECAERVSKEIGNIDILVHSLANGPEVQKPLLDTSRKGYLAAMSASAYSFVSMMQRFAPIMNPGGSVINLTYVASNRVIPGYGGGMSSAKAALESDTRVLAYEVGRKHNVRVNSISAGPLGSRAAKAIGFIDDMIKYSFENAPIQKELSAREVGNAAAFLASPLASAITGQVVSVDNGLSCMGLAMDSKCLDRASS